MRVVKVAEFRDSIPLFEYNVGAAQRELTYPGLQQCISITSYHVGRVLGTHLSPGSTSEELDETWRLLTTECGNYFPTWYVAGQFSNHFNSKEAIIKSMDKLRKTLRSALGKSATYYVFDTSALSSSMNYTYGIDIRVTLVNGEPRFGFAKSGGRRDKPFQSFSNWYFNRL